MDLSPPSESRQDLESLKSTAFVVHFDSPNATRRSTNNKRIRHMRNLSLPITGLYNSQVSNFYVFVYVFCLDEIFLCKVTDLYEHIEETCIKPV